MTSSSCGPQNSQCCVFRSHSPQYLPQQVFFRNQATTPNIPFQPGEGPASRATTTVSSYTKTCANIFCNAKLKLFLMFQSHRCMESRLHRRWSSAPTPASSCSSASRFAGTSIVVPGCTNSSATTPRRRRRYLWRKV